MRTKNNPYVPGDIIPEIGRVDTNHCGLPWPSCIDGNLFFGCVYVIETSAMHDALDGHQLTTAERDERRGNKVFDYADRHGKQSQRPQRELTAITQSIVDRGGFIQRIPFSGTLNRTN